MPSSPNVARRALLLLLLCPNAPAWCPGPPTARFASLRRTAATSGGDDAASGDDALSDTLLYIAQEAASRAQEAACASHMLTLFGAELNAGRFNTFKGWTFGQFNSFNLSAELSDRNECGYI